MRAIATRVVKAARLVRTPRLWTMMAPALSEGVFPALEHLSIPFSPHFATVVDVGTSRGQFGLFARARFPDARLICFEPLPEAMAVATRVLKKGQAEFHNVALGSVPGRMTLHVSAKDDSSSLLPIGWRQIEAFPGTQELQAVEVRVETLRRYLTADLPRPCLLKIDVQGAELDVLQGAGSALAIVDELLVEVSFAELYIGQPRAEAVIGYLADQGMRLVDIHGVARAADGSALQADLLFRRD